MLLVLALVLIVVICIGLDLMYGDASCEVDRLGG